MIKLAIILTVLLAAGAGTRRYDGKVTSIDGAKIGLAIRDGSTGNFNVGPYTRVFVGSKHVPLSEVKPGDGVAAWVTQQGNVEQLKIVEEPMAKPGKEPWGAMVGKAKRWEGKLTEVNEARGEIQIRHPDGKTIHFEYGAGGKNAAVYESSKAGGKKADFKALHTGQTVVITQVPGQNRGEVQIVE